MRTPKTILTIAGCAAALLLTGCGNPDELPAFTSIGWNDIEQVEDADLPARLDAQAAVAATAAYTASYRNENGDIVTIERRAGVSHTRLTGQKLGANAVAVGSPSKPIDVYAFDMTVDSITGRTVICSGAPQRCVEVTIALLGVPDAGLDDAIPSTLFGYNIGLLAAALDHGVHDAGLWKRLAEMSRDRTAIPSAPAGQKLTYDDRLVFTGTKNAGPLGTLECIGWVDSADDAEYENSVTGWCFAGDVQADTPRSTSGLAALGDAPGSLQPATAIEPLAPVSIINEQGLLYLTSTKLATSEFVASLDTPVRFDR